MSAFKDSGHHWWQQCEGCEMAWFVGDEPEDGGDSVATCKTCSSAPPAEPTTAEAFATVRDFINFPGETSPDDVRLALALLERRMARHPESILEQRKEAP